MVREVAEVSRGKKLEHISGFFHGSLLALVLSFHRGVNRLQRVPDLLQVTREMGAPDLSYQHTPGVWDELHGCTNELLTWSMAQGWSVF